MTIMTGLIIAIKENGFLALSSIAAPIYVLQPTAQAYAAD